MPKADLIQLRYRLWVHRGGPDEKDLADEFDLYNAAEAK
jgi:hypothetical protein